MPVQHIVIHTAAQAEFEESSDWYETRTVGQGARFEAAVKNRLAKLISNLAQGKEQWRGYREVRVGNIFPFMIVFRHYPEVDVLFVSAIFHTSRHPHRKYRRRS